jgi:hypothetical protein
MVKAECPVSSAPVFSRFLQREYAECRKWRSQALKRIAAMQPAAVVASSSVAYLSGDGRNARNPISVREWRIGMRETLAALDAGGAATLLLRDVPRPGFDVPTCLARAAWHSSDGNADCAFPRDGAQDDALFQAEREAASGLGRVSVVDLSDQFCGREQCAPTRNGMLVYGDTNHLTVAFSDSLSGVLGELIAARLAFDRRAP